MIEHFFCQVRPEHNVTADTGMGCGNCSDSILLCGKDTGIKAAFNITYQKEAMQPKGDLYQAFSSASVDPSCNDYVVAATTVTTLISSLDAKNNGEADPSCKQFWCG